MKKVEGRRQKANVLRRVLHYFCLLPSAFCIFLVRIYRVTLSPAKMFLFGPSAGCRFQPSCSQYAIEALKTHGAITGGWLAAKRVCRCHPWGEYGEDAVPPKPLQPLRDRLKHRFFIPRSALRVPRL